ncbi:HAD family phosphatase [Candidatus Woesearchaeota archaeon]|nr:HAD family phosphatase [Candidatus Woesearchaeota archaeon]
MKLVFLDLDGTLLTEAKVVEDTLRILDGLLTNGNKFCIATGRQLELIKELNLFDNREGFLILENGGIIGRVKNNQFEVFKEWEDKISPFMDEMDKLKVELGKNYEIIHKEKGFSIETYNDVKIPKEFPNITLRRNCDTLDFMPKIAGKKHAAVFLIEKLGFNKDNVVHVGDSMNDYELLEFVGNCGTVANADDAVKELVLSKRGVVSSHKETRGVKEVLSTLKLL